MKLSLQWNPKEVLRDSSLPGPQTFPARLAKASRGIMSGGLSLLYPPRCCACSQPNLNQESNANHRAVCSDCLEKIDWLQSNICNRCSHRIESMPSSGILPDQCKHCEGWPNHSPNTSVALASFQSPWRDLILALKFQSAEELIPFFGKLAAHRIKSYQMHIDNPILVPVPLTKSSFVERGFNQATELAFEIGKNLNLETAIGLLRKIKKTAPQAVLTAKERKENLKGAFTVFPKTAKEFSNRSIILIDDVMTTGATMWECATVLRKAGNVIQDKTIQFKEISCAVLARSLAE